MDDTANQLKRIANCLEALTRVCGGCGAVGPHQRASFPREPPAYICEGCIGLNQHAAEAMKPQRAYVVNRDMAGYVECACGAVRPQDMRGPTEREAEARLAETRGAVKLLERLAAMAEQAGHTERARGLRQDASNVHMVGLSEWLAH